MNLLVFDLLLLRDSAPGKGFSENVASPKKARESLQKAAYCVNCVQSMR